MTTATTKPCTVRRTVRSLALTLSAAAVATAVTATMGLGPAPASADPGDTFVPIGSSRVLQSEDLVAVQMGFDTESVALDRDQDFSACLGEGNPWSSVVPGTGKPINAAWTSRQHPNRALYETIAGAKTPAQAKRAASKLLNKAVRPCQGTHTRSDFHYGRLHFDRVGPGYATWAVSYRGNSDQPDGGVVVIRKDTNVGIVEVSGTWGPAEQMMESVAKVSVDRLAPDRW